MALVIERRADANGYVVALRCTEHPDWTPHPLTAHSPVWLALADYDAHHQHAGPTQRATGVEELELGP